MTGIEIGHLAAAKLAQETGWAVQFRGGTPSREEAPAWPAEGRLHIDRAQNDIELPVEIKRNLRRARLPFLRERWERDHHRMLIADYLSQPLQQELRANRINYLDAAGNAFLQLPDLFILVEGRRPLPQREAASDHTFKPAEISALLSLLIQPQLIQASYRTLEALLGTSKATLSGLLSKLRQHGFLTGRPQHYQWQRCAALLDRVAPEFQASLKPQLLQQRFQFARPQGHQTWTTWTLPPGLRWGGEAAAHLLDGFLYPEEWILYGHCSVQELLKYLPLKPHSEGPLTLYRQFWPQALEPQPHLHRVPLPIVYADLIGSGVGRNQQAASRFTVQLC